MKIINKFLSMFKKSCLLALTYSYNEQNTDRQTGGRADGQTDTPGYCNVLACVCWHVACRQVIFMFFVIVIPTHKIIVKYIVKA